MLARVDPREQQARAQMRAWGARARTYARTNLKQIVIFGGVSFAVGWVLNVWLMAGHYDGFRTPSGAPATGQGNVFRGAIFYLVASALISSTISYRLLVGSERFWREFYGIPSSIKRAFTSDSDQTLLHVLVGFSTALLLVLIVGPSVAWILAVVSLLAFTPVLRPIVTGALLTGYRWIVGRIAPKRTAMPPTVGMMVGVLGSTGAFALGGVLPQTSALVVWLVAIVAAIFIAQRRKPSTSAVLVALGSGVIAYWLLETGVVLADDGGMAECGNPGWGDWWSNCSGAATVRDQAWIGASGAGVGGVIGAALGGSADTDSDGIPDDEDWDWDGDGRIDGPPGPRDEDGVVDEDGAGTGDGRGPDDDEGDPVPVGGGGRPKEFDLDKIKLEDIDWDLMPVEMRERIRNQLIHEWRERNPGADYIRQQQAGREIDDMLTGDGPIKQWMDDAWQFGKDSAAFTWEDFKSGGALMSIEGAVEGIYEGLKTGAIGIYDLVTNAPEMIGVSVDFWVSQNPNASIQQIMEEIPGMGREMAGQFLSTMQELNDAALAGDNEKVGRMIGVLAGQAEFEVLMGAGTLKATTMGREAVAGTRIGKAIERAEDFVHGPTRRGGVDGPNRTATHTDLDNQGPTRRPGNEEVTVRQLEEDFGYEDFTAQHLDAKAKEHGVIIEMKPANPDSLDMIKSGDALAKPELLKPKTTNSLDVELGAPPGSEGKVSFFEPQKPRGFDDLPGDHPLVERYNTRAEQWQKYQGDMAELQLPPSERSPAFQDAIRRQYGTDSPLEIEIRDGLIYDKATGKPFTGDYDVWGFRDAKTGEYVSAARAEELYNDLGYAANPQHGPGTAHWEPPNQYLQDLKKKLQWEHSPDNPNGQNLLQFNGEGLPVTGWID